MKIIMIWCLLSFIGKHIRVSTNNHLILHIITIKKSTYNFKKIENITFDPGCIHFVNICFILYLRKPNKTKIFNHLYLIKKKLLNYY